jgi:putative hemolysin
MQSAVAAVATTQISRATVRSIDTHLTVRLASSASDVIAAQRLRYKVFCEEMGADLHRHDGRDIDQFDAYASI